MNLAPVIRRVVRVRKRRLTRRLRLAYLFIQRGVSEANPDFLGIGAPRAGTGWLHQRLARHPDVFLPRAKELHFFDGGRWGGPDAAFDLDKRHHWMWYWKQFQGARGRIKGDVTPSYASLPDERVAEIARHLPQCRIIYVLRDPVERAWSGLRHRLWHGRGVLAETLTEAELAAAVMNPEILRKGEYRENIRCWRRYYPAERFHFIFQDDIQERPRQVLENVCNFLGVSPARYPWTGAEGEKVNAVPGVKTPPRIERLLADYYRDQIEFLEDLIGRDLTAWRHDKVR